MQRSPWCLGTLTNLKTPGRAVLDDSSEALAAHSLLGDHDHAVPMVLRQDFLKMRTGAGRRSHRHHDHIRRNRNPGKLDRGTDSRQR
jgi:hypothetical protein